MSNSELIHVFYTAFSENKAKAMAECYHDDIIFKDPVFGELKGESAKKMWAMLLSNKNANLKITFSDVETSGDTGKAYWTAEYVFGKHKRKVVNQVNASFKFKDGKIIEHTDFFDLWKWSRQALGITGILLGWTPFLRSKIRKTVNEKLDGFMVNNKK